MPGMSKNLKLKTVILLLPLLFAGFLAGVGYFFGKETDRVWAGPYRAETLRKQVVFFAWPWYSWQDRRVINYGQVMVFKVRDIFEDGGNLAGLGFWDFLKHLERKKVRQNYIKNISLDRFREIVKKNSPIPGGKGVSLKRVKMYEWVAKAQGLLFKVNFWVVVGLGYLILLSMLFSKNGGLLFAWWWYVLCFQAGIYCFYAAWYDKDEGPLIFNFLVFWGIMKVYCFKDPLLWGLFIGLFFVIIPFIGIVSGLVYLTRHMFPRRKREINGTFALAGFR